MTALSARTRVPPQGDRVPAALPEAQAELMALAGQRLRGRPNGSMVLRQHAEDPGRWARPLTKALEAEGAGRDAELVVAAQTVMRLTDAAGTSRGKYLLDAGRPSGQAPG